MRRGYTRRQFLGRAAATAAAGAVVGVLPFGKAGTHAARASGVLSEPERAILDAALARMIPADGADDWSAADVGAGDYIEQILAGDGRIFAGGPDRASFPEWKPMSRTKEMGWADEVARLRQVYRDGLAELNRRAGGRFTQAPPATQDMILHSMDAEGSEFFRALYAHTMEGVYAHPVYGGNRGYRAWQDLCYQGDVHGVRFPDAGPADSPWRVHGGYSPEEMAQPGTCPDQGPVA